MLFSKLIKSLDNSEAELMKFEIGDNPDIKSGESIDKAKHNQISFLEKNSRLSSYLSMTRASAIILPEGNNLIDEIKNKGISWLIVRNPRLAFAEILGELNKTVKPKSGIHSSAIIGKDCLIDESNTIGPNVCIGDNCKLGQNNIIHPGVIIYENILIGNNNILHANSVIHPGTKIGNNCVINSNAVIGSEGFGFVPTKRGWKKMPQTGIVILENKVEVGSNSTIDRPAVGETRIGEDTKLDNLVQIGHGVSTGKSCAFASQVGIAGGAKIGNGVILAGQAGVSNRVSVGDGVIASSKCGITSDIESNTVISGFPAIPNKLWLRCSATFKKLPEIGKSIREINKKLISKNNL